MLQFKEIIVSQNFLKTNVQRDKERMSDICLKYYILFNYHLLPKQNSLTSADPWIIVESRGKSPIVISNRQRSQKTEVSKDRGLTIFILKKT